MGYSPGIEKVSSRRLGGDRGLGHCHHQHRRRHGELLAGQWPSHRDSGAYEQYIIRTVALDATLEAMAALGLLVIVRTFLSWALVVEMEGRWPWQPRTGAETESAPVRVAEDSLRRTPG